MELNLFYTWLQTNELTPPSIALWHGLMSIANGAGWPRRMLVPISRLEANTQMSRSSIYRERERLQQAGLIEFHIRGSKRSAEYLLLSFEERLVSRDAYRNASHIGTHSKSESENVSHDACHSVSHIGTHHGTIYKLNYTKDNKENIKRIEVGANAPPPLLPEDKKQRKSCAKKKVKREVSQIDNPRYEKFLKWIVDNAPTVAKMREPFSEEQFEQLMARYRAEEVTPVLLAMDNYLPLLKRNKSAYRTTLNWLSRRAESKPTQSGGQRVGQIRHPETEDAKARMIERFNRKK